MMKKFSVALVVVLSICLVASIALADMKSGTVKSVDAKAGMIVVTVDGKDMTYKAGKGVDLGKCKVGDKVEVKADKDVATEIKTAAAPAGAPSAAPAKKAPVGC